MTDTAINTADSAEVGADAHEHEHEHEHPSDLKYVKIALWLGFVTALEVGTYFWEDIFGSKPSTLALVVVLFPMMILKFVVVGAYFMHLKFDNPIFRRIFIAGMILAIIVYAGVFLTTMEFWSDNSFRHLRGS